MRRHGHVKFSVKTKNLLYTVNNFFWTLYKHYSCLSKIVFSKKNETLSSDRFAAFLPFPEVLTVLKVENKSDKNGQGRFITDP